MDRTTAPGRLYLVATPVGNLEDLSPRAVRILGEAGMVACEDTRHSRVLFDRCGIAPKGVTSYHAHNVDRKTGQLLAMLAAGTDVALISDAGTPGISDPGAVLVREAVAAGIVVAPVPGPSAPILALAASGFPTHRFVYEGFLPRKKGRRTIMESWREEKRTVLFLESPQRIVKTLEEIAERVGPERPVCVAREMTKVFEEFVRGTAAQVAAELRSRGTVKEEITVAVGPMGAGVEAIQEQREAAFEKGGNPFS